jgi:hypothetical protein
LAVEEPNHRHRRLLRARRERPPRGSAAEQRDELAPFPGREQQPNLWRWLQCAPSQVQVVSVSQ